MLEKPCIYTDTRGNRRSHRGRSPPVRRMTKSEQQPGEKQEEQQEEQQQNSSQAQVAPDRPSSSREPPHAGDGTIGDLAQQYAGQHVGWTGTDNTNDMEFENTIIAFSDYPGTIGLSDEHRASPLTTPARTHIPDIGLSENSSAPSMFQFLPEHMVETVPCPRPTGPASPIAPLPTPGSLNLKPYQAATDADGNTNTEFSEHQTAPNTPRSSTAVSFGQGCSCLQRVVLLIDELESQLLAASGESLSCLDSALASHKEAVRYGESMLACRLCSSRTENMTILGFLTERLVFLCDRIVAAYMEQAASAPVSSPDAEGAGPGMGATGKGRNAVLLPAQHDLAHQTVFFGDYEVDSPSEWNVLLGNLIVVQLTALNSLVGGTKASTHSRLRSVTTEKKIRDLLDKLGQFSVPYGR